MIMMAFQRRTVLLVTRALCFPPSIVVYLGVMSTLPSFLLGQHGVTQTSPSAQWVTPQSALGDAGGRASVSSVDKYRETVTSLKVSTVKSYDREITESVEAGKIEPSERIEEDSFNNSGEGMYFTRNTENKQLHYNNRSIHENVTESAYEKDGHFVSEKDVLKTKSIDKTEDDEQVESTPIVVDTTDCTVVTRVLGHGKSILEMTSGVDDKPRLSERKLHIVCNTTVQVPRGYFIQAFLENVWRQPISECSIFIEHCDAKHYRDCKLFTGDTFYPIPDHRMYVRVSLEECSSYNITIHYKAVPITSYKDLVVVHTSSKSGYVSTAGYDDERNYPAKVNAKCYINISKEEVVMVSFPHIDIEGHVDCKYDFLELFLMNESDTVWSTQVKTCGMEDLPTVVFNRSLMIHFKTDSVSQRSGFKMLFTILPASQEPEYLEDDLYNCSVPHFNRFAHHLRCDLAVNCLGEEDEQDCPYTSQDCGVGAVDAGHKCYTYSRPRTAVDWYSASTDCGRRNQTLVSPQTPQEWRVFKQLMLKGKKTSAIHTGLHTAKVVTAAVPSLYREVLQWADWTIAYFAPVAVKTQSSPVCSGFRIQADPSNLVIASCVLRITARVVCERLKRSKPLVSVVLDKELVAPLGDPDLWTARNVSLEQCESGYQVRDFLSCDLKTPCKKRRFGKLTTCKTHNSVEVKMFRCELGKQTVHYTLVCDFRLDCADGSDESFCSHGQCPNDQCRSGQCLSRDERCDGTPHCLDGSDENCPRVLNKIERAVAPPVLVHFDGKGGYRLQAMRVADTCPDTHFWCPGRHYCLPIYLRCNRVDDCPGREDEQGCEDYECHGYFRCRASRVCLHPAHVCDRVFHCPDHDDEVLCDFVCPQPCRCQGLAFVCPKTFSARSYPDLRYLDAGGSGMTLADVSDNVYLVYLRLSGCSIVKLSSVTSFPNLQILDLSNNLLSFVTMDWVLSVVNLQQLILSGNPITRLVASTSNTAHSDLNLVDLSLTRISTLNSTVFSNFPSIKELNFSGTRLTTVTKEGLASTPKLQVLDLRGSPIVNGPVHMLRDLSNLRRVYSDDFRLCCSATLPEHFVLENCHAPKDDFASCKDLLRSDVFRVFLWVQAFLAVVGNAGSFLQRFYVCRETCQNSFNILVTNLTLADLLMGVYLTIIGVADQLYRGRYVWYAGTWTKSSACQVAGFLSFLSSEVSAFFICLITLDRFLVLRFPFSRLHLGTRSALLAAGVAWTLGLAIAAVPLLPLTSHWRFYSQTGLCISLPFSHDKTLPGQSYSFGVMIVLNLLLFLLIALGQAFIYGAVRVRGVLAKTKQRTSRDVTVARRLTTIVLSDFLCWFPVGLLGVLSAVGQQVPTDVGVAVAIFVLPFNSALNPFLYTFNVFMEKRRKATEARMMRRLQSTVRPSDLIRVDLGTPVTKETALNQMEAWLGLSTLTLDDLAVRFDLRGRSGEPVNEPYSSTPEPVKEDV